MGDEEKPSVAEVLREAIERHKERFPLPQQPDHQAEKEQQRIAKKTYQDQELTRRDLQNELLKDLIDTRKDYSGKIFTFLVYWSAGVGIVLVLQGFSVCGFSLPESVLDFLVGSTTANIIALVGLVVKGLFPAEDSKS